MHISGTHHTRFDLAAGELDDMVCGNNGMNFNQVFRPSYFTADWSDGSLAVVRIWGPRLLQDGSTRLRMLDHCWRRSLTNGPIDINSLPATVARRLRAYGTKNR